MKPSIKRPTVGLLVSGLTEYFTASICRGVMQAAKAADVNLVILPGKNIDRDFSCYPKIIYEYQYGTLFEYPSPENLDAVIVSADAIGCYSTKESIDRLLSQYQGMPCVLIASKHEPYPSVNYDNNLGIREAMEYLIHTLGCRRFGMIGGPMKNTDAKERKKVFLDILNEHALPFEERNYAEGDLTRFAVDTPGRFLDQNPDIEAIFCVNDDTAIPLYAEMKKRGITPGKDIYVFGYDNASFASQMTPTLTSVWADTGALGTTALEMVLDLLAGKEVSSIVLPTRLIRRDSFGERRDLAHIAYDSIDAFLDSSFDLIFYRCRHSCVQADLSLTRKGLFALLRQLFALSNPASCQPAIYQHVLQLTDQFLKFNTFRDADVNNLTTVLEDLCLYLVRSVETERKKYEIQELFSLMYRKIIHAMNSLFGTVQAEKEEESYMFKLFVNDLTQFEKGNDQSYANILSGLDFTGIQNAALYLFREPILHLNGESFVCPDTVRLKTVLKNGSVRSIPLPHQEMRVQDIFRYPGIPRDQFSMVLLPLFSNEFLYGLVLCDLTENLFSNGEFLLNQMSSAAKMIQLLRANESIQIQLEESLGTLRRNNIELDTLSRYDPLTGILNRRGFFDAAEKLLAARSGEEGFLAIYADLNNLKIINDRYGHEEGDFSIRLTGKLLRDSIGKNGICGRIGGDEFACLVPCSDPAWSESLYRSLHRAFAMFNRTSEKAYNITVSTGFYLLPGDKNSTLQEMLAHADSMLYEEKQKREKNVAKILQK